MDGSTPRKVKKRLDQEMVRRGLVRSRSQAESFIKLGKVFVDEKLIKRPGFFVGGEQKISLVVAEQYVSRAGLKLASVADALGVDFAGKTVLDVGSSTGGFTDYALRRGARKVFAVDVGTDQLHPSLRDDERISLHEKTDIRDFSITGEKPDITVMDVSFISLRDILPHIAAALSSRDTTIVAMVKPQFEAGKHHVNKGVIKNDSVRRQILKDFEEWAKQYFIIQDKRDSDVAGSKGNRERFYALKLL